MVTIPVVYRESLQKKCEIKSFLDVFSSFLAKKTPNFHSFQKNEVINNNYLQEIISKNVQKTGKLIKLWKRNFHSFYFSNPFNNNNLASQKHQKMQTMEVFRYPPPLNKIKKSFSYIYTIYHRRGGMYISSIVYILYIYYMYIIL